MLLPEATRSTATLASRIQGDAYGPADAGYDEARQGFYLDTDLRPALVALPESADDVVAIMTYAREHGLRVAPQSTGHNGYPLRDRMAGTILLKTSRMRGVEIDAERKVARAEAGAWWIDVSEPASALGLAPLAGSSPDVGVVGYTLGGGVSWLARKYGLGANNVVAIEIVTPDGRLVRADHVNEPELFWAVRGGGGNFGVVTAIELRLYELPELYAGVMFFPVERAAEVLKTWREWVRTVPDEATSIARVLNVPDIPDAPEPFRGRAFATIEMAFIGSQADGEALIEPIRALGPETDMFAAMPPIGLARLHMDPEGNIPGGRSDSRMYTDALDDDAIDHIVAVVGGPSPLMMFELRHLGGALTRTSAGHGALERLDGEFLAFSAGMTLNEEMSAMVEAHLGKAFEPLAAYESGRQYLNFVEHATGASSFFGEGTLARLSAVRDMVDPDRVMQANHGIG